MIVPVTPLGKVAEQMRTYRAALKEAGRRADAFPIIREVSRGSQSPDRAGGMQRALANIAYDAYASWGMGGREKPPFEEYARDRFIIGDAAFVKEEVARYREALGVDRFHDAVPLAGAGAGEGAGVNSAAGGDFWVGGLGLRVSRP